MWVMTPDKMTLVKINNVFIGEKGKYENNIYYIMGDKTVTLGRYSSQENAKLVLKEMKEHILHNYKFAFEMPSDEKVDMYYKGAEHEN